MLIIPKGIFTEILYLNAFMEFFYGKCKLKTCKKTEK